VHLVTVASMDESRGGLGRIFGEYSSVGSALDGRVLRCGSAVADGSAERGG
jgi:hypothetical protein